MSYRAYGCSSWVVEWDVIKSIAPEEATSYEAVCDLYMGGMDTAALECAEENIQPEDDEFIMARDALVDKFCEVTGGLGLVLGYIQGCDSDSDITGAVWFVEGVQEFTPAGKKYADKISFIRWVEYG